MKKDIPQHEVLTALATIAKHIASVEEVRKAVLLILGLEQDRFLYVPNLAMPADIAHAYACEAYGKQEGLDRAALLLTDSEAIEELRKRLEEANPEKEQS